jgi:hypothetical protein
MLKFGTMEYYRNIEQIEETYRKRRSETEYEGTVQRAVLFVAAHLYKSKLTVGWMEE